VPVPVPEPGPEQEPEREHRQGLVEHTVALVVDHTSFEVVEVVEVVHTPRVVVVVVAEVVHTPLVVMWVEHTRPEFVEVEHTPLEVVVWVEHTPLEVVGVERTPAGVGNTPRAATSEPAGTPLAAVAVETKRTRL